MKAIKILAIAISLPLFFSCEKENISKDYYRIEIVSETPGDLVANTPSYEKIPVKKGKTTLLFDRVGNEETLFVLYRFAGIFSCGLKRRNFQISNNLN